MFRYKIGSVVVCSCLLFGAANAAYAAEPAKSPKASVGTKVNSSAKQLETEYVRSTVDRLNVRTEPNLSASVIQMIRKTNRFELLGKQDNWVKIKLEDKKDGWVFADYIEYVKESPKDSDSERTGRQPSQRLAQETVANIITNTNLRKGPGIDTEIIGKARPGESLPIVGTEGEWYKVSLQDGGTAYVASWVVENANGNPGSAPRTNGDANLDAKVYIYHTHNRESWKNVAGDTKGSSIDDRNVNITLVGKRLGERLQENGISTITGDDDFAQKLAEQKLGYAHSYSESRKAVTTAAQAHPSLSYFFDIHRDSDVPRKTTSVTIDGKPYARILFVIGSGHPDYAKNKKFAEAMSELLEKKYPGLSRGVLLKSSKEGDGEYNQSVSPGSLLMEFGGIDNTLQECLRTAEAFADVFADYYGSSET